MKLKQACSISGDYGLNIAADQYIDDGIPMIRTSDFNDFGRVDLCGAKRVPEDAVGTKYLRKGDILFSRSGTIGRCLVWTADVDATFAAYLVRYRSIKRLLNSRFVTYWAQSEAFWSQVRAETIESTIGNFNAAKISNLKMPEADIETQSLIANFLDLETARIDQLIEKKGKLVELLHERSLSAIEKAVTADARLSKLGHHVRILPGYAFASSAFSANEEDIRLLRGSNVSPGKTRWEDVVYWPRDAVADLDRFRLEAGDIVMGMDRPWVSGGIRVAEITESDLPALLLQRVCKITPLKTLSKEYLKLLLSSKKFLGYFEPELTGVSVPHISGDQIAGFRFAYLPVSQQAERAKICRKAPSSNQAIIEQAQKSIARLQEFRSAIITAAVTGQIDVATWGKQGQTDRRLDRIEEAMRA